MELSETVKEWRRDGALTQSRAAEILKMPLRSLQHIEQGRSFRYPTILALAIEALRGRGNGS
ncbi:XRE family transcriptional regulator [Rhizobium sp. YTU87027]|uniref:XRE family transcriptional regulator n=1 Tax=Rhizobium sp. YTU87027 TaxID=3417741 RepID=UPI003D69D3D1